VNLLLLTSGEDSLDRRDPRARHIEKVLRARVGDTVRAGIIGGGIGNARITAIDNQRLRLEVDTDEKPRPLAPLELLLGHPRPIVLQRMLRDLTAIGLQRITIVPTDLGEKSYHRSNMWQRVHSLMIEGASQGGTTRLPELIRADSLEAAMGTLAASEVARLVLHPDEPTGDGADSGVTRESLSIGKRSAPGSPTLHQALAERAAAPLALAIGSERGWSERELQLLGRHGFERVGLGPRVLRTETAATVAVWTATNYLHSLGSRP